MVQEVTPVVHFLDTELRIVGEGLELMVSGMETVYLANQQLLKSAGRGLDGAGEYLILSGQGLTMAYKEFHTQLVQDLHVFLDATKHFPINQHYWRLLSTIADAVRTAGRSSAETLEEMLAVIDQYLLAARRRMLHFRNNISDFSSAHISISAGMLTAPQGWRMKQ
nr:hypothetical protein BaRGS_024871 [Batillaria attramentaria]